MVRGSVAMTAFAELGRIVLILIGLACIFVAMILALPALLFLTGSVVTAAMAARIARWTAIAEGA